MDYDILICGAGAVGASLAAALASAATPWRIGIIETRPRTATTGTPTAADSFDDRGLALSSGSRQILADSDVWPALTTVANPIKQIHVSHRGHFGCVRLTAAAGGLPALGYVVPARALGAALLARLDAAAIDWHCPATVTAVSQTETQVTVSIETAGASGAQQLTTRLLIGADGSQSQLRNLLAIATRRKDYGQTAIVSSVATASAHADTAYERFTDSGPLALLPRRDGRSVVVCCLPTEQAAAVMLQSDTDFLQLLQQRFGQRLGRFSQPAARQSYPIRLIQAQEQYRGRVLLLGNAVHTVHPNAAQGFNLGLHDASALAVLLSSQAQTADQDPGSAALLSAYLAEREPVQRRVVQFTDWLAWWFYQPHTLLAPARTLGMLAIDKLPTVKQRFIRRLTGLGGRQ